MLKFIFGRPVSGKTYTLIEEIKSLTFKGKPCVLMVPEQASFETERMILKALGDKQAMLVSVISFSRLFDEVGRKVGGIAGITLSGADKVIFMNRALISLESQLKLWKRYCSSVTFAKTMLDTVGEFKISAVKPDDLKEAAKGVKSPTLKQKLLDIALIYQTYDGLVGEKFIDTADSLEKLYVNLEEYKYFEGKEVFIDSFKGFTGQQFKIIDRIISQAENVTVSMTNAPENNDEFGVFSNIRKAVERIRKSAIKMHKTEKEPIVLAESRYNSKGIGAVEKMLSGTKAEETNDGSVTICAADTKHDEALFAARTIRKLVRTENYRYSDFVIITRDAQMYEESVNLACKANGVACFTDKRIPLSSFSISSAVEAAMESAVSLSTDSILRFHKTGIGTLSVEEISALENYAFLWNIGGSRWKENWDMDPRGFVTDILGDKEKAELEKLNSLRQKAVEPILTFSKEFSGTAKNMAVAVVNLLDFCNAGEKLALMSSRHKLSGNEFSSEVLKQSYDIFMALLDSIVNCFGKKTLTKQEFYDALTLAVSFETVGVIPRMLDEVTFGAADRIRPSRPKVAIILGANQGVFPKYQQNSGILSQAERQNLLELGVEIPDNVLSAVVDENYLVYSNLCCPTDRLYICYSRYGLSGNQTEPSTFVEEIKELTSAVMVTEPNYILTEENLPETEESAYSEYCRRYLGENTGAAEIKEALMGQKSEGKISFLESALSGETKQLKPQTAKKLFGSNIYMSATRLDTYRKCPFSYFCRYGLSAKKLRPADFDVLQRGTIVHYVLEQIITEYKKKIANLSKDETDALVDKYIAQYLDSVAGYRTAETEKEKFLVSRISRSLKEVVLQLSQEFAQSDFEPTDCELKIGSDDGIPALKIPFPDGEVSLVGSIDRVDKYNGYIRVVDYKTGSRKFKLPDILFGLNLQMLIYLYAAVKGLNLEYDKAAGILYMPSKRDLDGNGMAMNGLLQKDKDLIMAMDKELNGEFVPKMSFTKNGDMDKRCTSFITADEFSQIFNYIEKLIGETGKDIVSGKIAIEPIDGRDLPACKYCDYASCCGIENGTCKRVPDLKNEQVFEFMKEENENGI